MTLGIDFGYSQIKMVQLEKTSTGYSLQNIGTQPIVGDINTFNPEKIGKSNWSEAIQNLWHTMKINPKRTKNVVSVIAGNSVSARQISTLELSKEELFSSLEFEAKKHIPMDGSDPVLDYHYLGSDPKELDKMIILLVATSKKLVNYHNEIIRGSGFKTGIFDAEPISMANAYIGNYGLCPEGADVILNIGNQNTTLVAWGKNQRFFTRDIRTGGYQFTQAVMKTHKLSFGDAEKLKLEKGIESLTIASTKNGDDSPFSLQVAEKTIFSVFAEEIRKTLRYYIKSNPQAFFNHFYLCGGSASVKGLPEYLAEQLNVKVDIFDTFKKIEGADSIDNPSQYTVAVGCAMRGLEKKGKS